MNFDVILFTGLPGVTVFHTEERICCVPHAVHSVSLICVSLSENVDEKAGKPDFYSSWACHCACRVVMDNCIPFLHMCFICNSSACFHTARQLCFKHVFATVTPAWHGNDCSSSVFTWHNILVLFVTLFCCVPRLRTSVRCSIGHGSVFSVLMHM